MFAGFDSHVDDTSERERRPVGPFCHTNDLVLPGQGVLIALKRRRGRAEKDGAFFEAATHDREIARVILWWVFLFVGGFVFFIDDDESEVGQGGKNSGASSDDDAGFASANTMPFVESLALGKVGVHHGDLVDHFREAGFEALHSLGGEGDFGNQNDDVLSEIEGFLSRLKIDFGFPGSGDAVKEDGIGRIVRVEALGDRVEDFGLFRIEGESLSGNEYFAGVRVASYFEIDEFDPAFFSKAFQRGCR